jgi:Bacterial extracellular solute-binding proteins, family 3
MMLISVGTTRLARSLLLACMMTGAGMLYAYAGGEKELLAPTGHLRVGVYNGSPTSMVSDAKSGQTHGLTYDLGRELAARLNVPVEYVTFQRIADVIDAMKDGQLDFTVTNATPVRKELLSFSQLLVAIELGYLVPANSSIGHPDEMDQPGIRIGVTKGGTSERTLSRTQRSSRPRASSLRPRCYAAASSTCTPPTRPFCSKCRTRCRGHGFSTAIGASSTCPSPFPEAASQACRSSKVLCGRYKATDCWKKFSRNQD